ncbi:Gmad2 immunoglobulin-like domain-containing protein [Nocardioides sp.]|uniref:Gmad2 immunoglobulin-like domain-containing protein n=1 Tax=Nocardioides sp. TaxID=35761 RepID=UPI0035B3EE88
MTFPMSLSVRRWAGAAAFVAGSLALAGCAADDPVPASGDATDAAKPTKKPSRSASQEPTEQPASESPSEPSSTVVPVYYVGDGPGGKPVLFREFHRVTGDPLTEAARLVAGGGQPDDPDYRTLWPQVELSVAYSPDGVFVVDIPSDAFTERPDGMSERGAELAMQQLVYTLQGVQQERAPVQVKRGGTDFRLFGLPSDTPYEQASPLRTLSLVNITSPAEGDTVTGDTLTVTGVSNSFEASGPCRLIAGDEEVALEGYQAEGWMDDRLFPFEVELPLADVGSGDVLLQCETDDPSGGTEGDGPSVDTKLIHVG